MRAQGVPEDLGEGRAASAEPLLGRVGSAQPLKCCQRTLVQVCVCRGGRVMGSTQSNRVGTGGGARIGAWV